MDQEKGTFNFLPSGEGCRPAGTVNAKAHNETRSGLLVKAATAYISQRSARPGPSRTLRTSPAKKRPRVRPGSR